MSYRFVAQYQHEFDVAVMCAAFGVSRSGYYAWHQRGQTTQHEEADERLTAHIRQIFEDSHATYGSPRIYAELKAQGHVCSRHRVARLMRQAGIGVAIPRRRVRTTQSDGQQHSTPNLLARDFRADAPNRKWLVDITAVSTDEGCLYMAGVLDLFSRRLVGWAMDEHMPDELTQAALEMAILQRQPPAQLLHHSDQGSQYTSEEYQALLAKHHMLTSLSGVGCCYDNAPVESFWGTLSKPNWFIVSTIALALKLKTRSFLISKAGITASVVIRRWAISVPSSSNNSFGLNFLSIPLVQGHFVSHTPFGRLA